MLKLEKRTISYLFVSARIRVNDPFSQMKPEYNTILDDADSANHIDSHPQRGGRGVLLTSSERDDRMGQNQNPKKPMYQNLTPKKSLAEFPSHNSFQRAETVEKQVWFYTLFAELTRRAYAGTTTNLHIV